MPAYEILLTETWPGVYRLEAPWAYAQGGLNTWIKEGDGGKEGRRRYHFDAGPKLWRKKAWYIPEERLGALRAYAGGKGWPVRVIIDMRTHDAGVLEVLFGQALPPEHTTPLTAWQREGLLRLLLDRTLLAQWITGSGKSRLALEAHHAVGGKTLIVAPKVVLRTWEEEQIPRWAPDVSHWTYVQGRKLQLKEGRGETQTTNLRPQSDITLVSWGSMHKIPEEWKFDFLVFDELHAGIHGTSNRSAKAVELSTRYPKALRLGLTATPTSASLTDLHSQLNILSPHRWGTFRRWWGYFFHEESVGFEDHVKPGELRADRLPELLAELDTVCHYVAHEDVGDALPPVDWQQLDIGHECATRLSPPESIQAWRQEQLRSGRTRAAAFVGALERKGWGKELHRGANGNLPEGQPPTAIVVYHRDLANEVVANLDAVGVECAHVSGEMPPKQRHAVLAEASVAVMTMRSVTEGLDLRRFTQVYVLEAYPVPLYLTQILGRFIRLYAENAVSITFCRLRGSSDDVVVHKLLTRMAERRKLLTEGKTEKGLAALLSIDENSEDFLVELRAACAELEEDEADLWDDGTDWE